VHCIRADNGRYRWVRKLTERGGTIWPPVAYREHEGEAVVFTRLDDVVFLLPDSGKEFLTYELHESSVAACSVGRNTIFAAETGHRIHNYDVDGQYQRWQVRRPGQLRLSPVYLHGRDLLVFADDSGKVAGATGKDKTKVFETELEGTPLSMAVGENAIYIATSDNLLYQVSHKTGNILWKYFLPAAPKGDPVITKQYVYQAVGSENVLRIHKARTEPTQTFKGAEKFLAEWPKEVVLLSNKGEVLLVSEDKEQKQKVVDLGGLDFGVANTKNPAILVGTKKGIFYCLLPAKMKKLEPVAFKSPRMPKPEPQQKPGERPGMVKLVYPTTLFGEKIPSVEVPIESLK